MLRGCQSRYVSIYLRCCHYAALHYFRRRRLLCHAAAYAAAYLLILIFRHCCRHIYYAMIFQLHFRFTLQIFSLIYWCRHWCRLMPFYDDTLYCRCHCYCRHWLRADDYADLFWVYFEVTLLSLRHYADAYFATLYFAMPRLPCRCRYISLCCLMPACLALMLRCHAPCHFFHEVYAAAMLSPPFFLTLRRCQRWYFDFLITLYFAARYFHFVIDVFSASLSHFSFDAVTPRRYLLYATPFSSLHCCMMTLSPLPSFLIIFAMIIFRPPRFHAAIVAIYLRHMLIIYADIDAMLIRFRWALMALAITPIRQAMLISAAPLLPRRAPLRWRQYYVYDAAPCQDDYFRHFDYLPAYAVYPLTFALRWLRHMIRRWLFSDGAIDVFAIFSDVYLRCCRRCLMPFSLLRHYAAYEMYMFIRWCRYYFAFTPRDIAAWCVSSLMPPSLIAAAADASLRCATPPRFTMLLWCAWYYAWCFRCAIITLD